MIIFFLLPKSSQHFWISLMKTSHLLEHGLHLGFKKDWTISFTIPLALRIRGLH